MQERTKLMLKIGLGFLAIVGLISVIAYWPRNEPGNAQGGDWTCSMHPQIRKPSPGRCPICGMDLVPVAQLTKEQDALAKRAGILTEPVTYRQLFKEIRTVGKLDYNERQSAYIAARISGRVDRVYADFTGIQVKKNDHLVDIYSPDLFVAQGELIRAVDALKAAKKDPGEFGGSFAESTLESVRTKLRLLGVLPEQLQEIEKTKKIQTHLTIFAPIGGTVIEKSVRTGQYVKEGDVLYRIADLDPIWLYLDLYESDLGWVNIGQKVDVSVEAYPGVKFEGKVTFIDPFLDDKTRTVRARVNMPNAEKRLKPGMYASATIRVGLRANGTPEPTGLEGKYICPMHPEVISDKPGKCTICEMKLEQVPKGAPLKKIDHKGHSEAEHKGHEMEKKELKSEPGKVLAIRTSAVLDTGRRQIAYRQNKDGAYELVEVQLGPRADGLDDNGQKTSYFLVLGGLQAQDRVVMQGGFLLDSQRQIEGMPSLLYPEGQSNVNLHSGHGGAPPAKKAGDEGHKNH